MEYIGFRLEGIPHEVIPISKQNKKFFNLKEKIIDLISKDGPIGLDRYMELCLYDRDFGYYTTKNPFGKKGDFVTSPEISQMFGELIGAWSFEVWEQLGAPKNLNLIELGPGNGTLLSDLITNHKIKTRI